MTLQHLFLAGLLLVAAGPARAEISELRGGILRHDIAIFTDEREPGWDANLEILFDAVPVVTAPRPQFGMTINTQGDTSHAYLGLAWEVDLPADLFAGLSLGGAVHDGELKAHGDHARLGTRFLFRESVVLGLRLTEAHNLSLMFDHVSNANLSETNGGLETLGVRYGLRF